MMYYKVVNRDLKSVQTHRCVAGVQYILGEWVHAHKWLEARGYGLFVFDDLLAALEFRDMDGLTSRVFVCEIQGLMEQMPDWGLPASTTNPLSQSIQPVLTKELWLEHLEYHAIGGGWPEGTVMAKSVKLVREIV